MKNTLELTNVSTMPFNFNNFCLTEDLTEQELIETEGGILPIIAFAAIAEGFALGIGCVAAAVAIYHR